MAAEADTIPECGRGIMSSPYDATAQIAGKAMIPSKNISPELEAFLRIPLTTLLMDNDIRQYMISYCHDKRLFQANENKVEIDAAIATMIGRNTNDIIFINNIINNLIRNHLS